MVLHTERSAVVPVADQELGFIVTTQQADNQLLVADGQTAVIGGLTVTEVNKTRSGIPMLSRLPLLGPLFSFSSNQERRRDLIILVTPRILDDNF
jgi:type IV pilus assembly protein PilQ